MGQFRDKNSFSESEEASQVAGAVSVEVISSLNDMEERPGRSRGARGMLGPK